MSVQPLDPPARPAWVLLRAEGIARGFKSTLSFRRWCQRNRVPIRKTGKLETVCPCDVDAAVLARPAPPPANDVSTLAAEAVARSLGGHR